MAGTLELVDGSFSNLAQEVDVYGEEVSRMVSAGNLDTEINTVSLLKYLPIKLRPLESKGIAIVEGGSHVPKAIIYELENFGFHYLFELDKILDETFF